MSGVNNEVYSLLRDIRDTQLKQAETIGEIKGQLSGLCGPEGRITKIEQDKVREGWKSFGKHALTVIVAIAGHKAIKLLGLDL